MYPVTSVSIALSEPTEEEQWLVQMLLQTCRVIFDTPFRNTKK